MDERSPGQAERTWPRGCVEAVHGGLTGLLIEGKEGAPEAVLAYRPLDEVRWLAGLLRRELELEEPGA